MPINNIITSTRVPIKIGVNKDRISKTIEDAFDKAKHQADVLLAIYRLYIPDFDRIKHIQGHPEAGRELWLFIADLFVKFDKANHPGVMPGGLWLNTGFSHGEHLKGWEVSLKHCSFTY